MKNDDTILRLYADVLGDHPDAKMLRLARELDAASRHEAPYTVTVSIASTLESRARTMAGRAAGGKAAPRTRVRHWITGDTARGMGPDRPGHYFGGLVAGLGVLVVAVVLAAALLLNRGGTSDGTVAGGGLGAAPTATTAPQSAATANGTAGPTATADSPEPRATVTARVTTTPVPAAPQPTAPSAAAQVQIGVKLTVHGKLPESDTLLASVWWPPADGAYPVYLCGAAGTGSIERSCRDGGVYGSEGYAVARGTKVEVWFSRVTPNGEKQIHKESFVAQRNRVVEAEYTYSAPSRGGQPDRSTPAGDGGPYAPVLAESVTAQTFPPPVPVASGTVLSPLADACPNMDRVQDPKELRPETASVLLYHLASPQRNKLVSDRTLWSRAARGLISRRFLETADTLAPTPAARSPYAELIKNACGKRTAERSWWIRLCEGVCDAPGSSPSRDTHLFLIKRGDYWLFWAAR